jgi:RHS repeat-associated protein
VVCTRHGNTFEGCTVGSYYATRQEAAQDFSEGALVAHNQICCSAPNNVQYKRVWYGALSVPAYAGPNAIWWSRSTFFSNSGVPNYGILADYIFPICPIFEGRRPTPRAGDEATACLGGALEVKLEGPNQTRALPAGPAVPITAKVTQNGAAAAGKAVSISIAGGGTVSGTTGAGGDFRFTYVPPRHKAIDQLTGTCAGCINVARKNITVEACDICGDEKGNPISTATGEKKQVEPDWQDGAPHPLSLAHVYRSFDNIEASMGPRWSHSFAGFGFAGDLEGVVRFGDGSKVLFGRASTTDPWVADNRRDALAQTPTGLTYVRASDESRWQFDAMGKLVAITQRNGWTMTLAYDAANRLTGVTNAFGRTLGFAYEAGGRLAVITTPEGRQIAYAYDAIGRLASASYAGAARTYHYEDARWPLALTGVTDESGIRYASFGYDASGRAVNSQHAGALSYNISYQADFNPVGTLQYGATVDAAIYRVTTQIADPLGTPQSYVWQGGDGQVRLLGASGPFDAAALASRTFDAVNLPATETDFLGVQTLYTWDANRQLKLSTTKASGLPETRTTTTEWHPTLRLPVRIAEAGRVTAFTYDALGNKLTESITDSATAQARTWQWAYNGQGLVETMTDPKGGLWRYGYDAAGNLASEKNPLGQQTSYSHDAAGRIVSQTEPNGLVTTFGYDLRGHMVSQTRAGEVSTFTYAPNGLLTSARLPNGLQVDYSYDTAQRLIAAADNRGNRVDYTLDAAGNRIREEVKDASGSIALVAARVINSLNKVAAIQDSVGQTTALAYDANGELASTTDPLNQTTRQSLDGLRRPTTTTFADNTSAAQAWNPLDQLTQVTDPKGVRTTYQTNAFGEVTSETSPDIGTITYTRDANGEVIATQDAKGQISRIERDALGRPTLIDYAQNHVASFQYDAGGHVTRIDDNSGSTVYTRDAQGRVLAKTQSVNDNPSSPMRLKVAYTYEGGDLASATYPSGLTVFYRRSAGRITGIDVQPAPNASGKAQPVVPFVASLTHTALGQPRSWSWRGGDTAARTFDTDGRMTGNEIASYTFDAANRITGITQTLWAQKTVTTVVNGKNQTTTELYQAPITWNSGYDSRNRLTGLKRSGAETSYSYDANSNRLTALDTTSGEVDLEAAFDAPNFTQSTSQRLQLDAASNKLLGFAQTITRMQGGTPVGSSTSQINYSLDANGAMTSDGLRTFEYDESRRLSKVKILQDGEAASVEYLHNALGQRVFKSQPQMEQTLPNEEELGPGFVNWLRKSFGWLFTQGNSPKSSIGLIFAYDEDANLVGEYDNGSAQGLGSTEYIWLPAKSGQAIPIGIYRNGKFYQVHSDHLGTPRLVTDSANQPVWQWPYSAFGNNRTTGVLSATTTSSGQVMLRATKAPVTVNLRFPGQYWDEESNLAYNLNRSYQAGQGRYTQFDPIGLAGGLNRFAYANANPLSLIDPSGLDTKCTWVGPVLACQSVPSPGADPFTPRPTQPIFPTIRVPESFPDWLKSEAQCSEEQADKDRCSRRKDYCIAFCQYELDMPDRHDNTGPFRACIRRCMNAAGCTY